MVVRTVGGLILSAVLSVRIFLPYVGSTGASIGTATPVPSGPPPGWQTVNSFDALPAACKGFIPREENTWQFLVNFEDATIPFRGCMKERYAGTKYAYSYVPCEAIGSVSVMTGTATFSGGYVRCTNFDPRGSLANSDQSRHEKFYMWANAKPAVSLDPQSHVIFKHEGSGIGMWADTQLKLGGAPLLFRGAHGLRTELNGSTYTMTTRIITASVDGFHSYYTYQNCSTLPCKIEHKLDDVTYQSYAPVTYTVLSTKPFTVFIGGDGIAAGQRFTGQMREFILDPQIRSDCC